MDILVKIILKRAFLRITYRLIMESGAVRFPVRHVGCCEVQAHHGRWREGWGRCVFPAELGAIIAKVMLLASVWLE